MKKEFFWLVEYINAFNLSEYQLLDIIDDIKETKDYFNDMASYVDYLSYNFGLPILKSKFDVTIKLINKVNEV